MIIGTGIDIVDINRFKKSFVAHENSYYRKIFTKQEHNKGITYNNNRKIEFFAGRFAAKEAIAKALGCGFGAKLKWLDVEILADNTGKPSAKVDKQLQNYTIHVSISHEKNYTIASAIIYSNI